MPNMIAEYLGLPLSSPVVVSACPMTLRRESARELAMAGAGALVLPSLFEEQIVRTSADFATGSGPSESRAESPGDPEGEDDYNGGPEAYLRAVGNLKQCVGVPVIASLDGYSNGSWLGFCRNLERAGADAVELTLHPNTWDPALRAEMVEQWLIDCVSTVCQEVAIPVSVKLVPFFTSLAHVAQRLAEAGVTGLTVFAHEPNWNIHLDRLQATRAWSLTHPGSVEMTLAGLIRVRGGAPDLSIAASGGVTSAGDALKTVVAGADVAMVTSEIYREGPCAVTQIVDGMRHYLKQSEYESFEALRRSRPQSRDSIRNRTQDVAEAMPSCYAVPPPAAIRHSGDRWGHQES